VPDRTAPGAEVIEAGLRGWTGALGPAVPLARAASLLRWGPEMLARAAAGPMAAQRRGAWRGQGVAAGRVGRRRGLIRCEEHLATWLGRGEEWPGAPAPSACPVARLRPVQQDVVWHQDAVAWLQERGATPGLPRARMQCTADGSRYRCAKIQELFGPVLGQTGAGSSSRWALRARELLRGGGPATQRR